MLQAKAFSSSHLMVPLTLPLLFILIKWTVHHLHCSSVWLQQSSLSCPFPWGVTFSFPFIIKTVISTYTHFPDIPHYMISRELQNAKGKHTWMNKCKWVTDVHYSAQILSQEPFHEYAKLHCTNPQKRWDCCTT